MYLCFDGPRVLNSCFYCCDGQLLQLHRLLLLQMLYACYCKVLCSYSWLPPANAVIGPMPTIFCSDYPKIRQKNAKNL